MHAAPARAEARYRSVAPGARTRDVARRAPPEAEVKTSAIALWMLAAIALVTALAFWDEERESKAALDDFVAEQTSLADALASSLEQALAIRADGARRAGTDPLEEAPGALLHAILTTERAGLRRVFLVRPASPSSSRLVASDGAPVESPALEAASQLDATSVTLSRPEAARLGLPARTAIAGVRTFSVADSGRFGIVVVATAEAVRDRERRAGYRLALSVGVTTGLVLLFGGLALRKQRMELELAHRLALGAIANERDERLVRADKLATMGALATGVAHEVSTPLGVILGRAEQLLPKQTDERARRAVETIVEQSERISHVVRGFLALARGGEPALAHADPAQLARAAVDLCEHRFSKAGVTIQTDVASNLPRVACDARLFEQVLVNLLLNACDACEGGGVVELAVRSDGEKVAFVVTDDGVGISSSDAARATEPFFTTKPQGKGTGLGLAIANEIVKHHRGELVLRPRETGRGTHASVELPAIR